MASLLDSINLRAALACLVLGAMAATGFAPLEIWPLTLLGLAGLIYLVGRASTLRAALWRGWCFGVGHFTVNDNWFQHAFDFQTAMPPVLGYAAPLALALYLAAFPALAAGIAWSARRWGDASFVMVFAAAWIATEWLRGTVFTGYAWDPIAAIWMSWIGVARLAAWIGTYALSGLTVLAAGLLALGKGRARAASLALIAIAALSASWTQAPAAPADAPRVRIVQPGIGEDRIDKLAPALVIARMNALSGHPGSRARLIVWPEGEVRDYIEDGYPAAIGARDPHAVRRDMVAPLGNRDVLMAGGTALSFDAHDRITGATNSVFVLTPDGLIVGRYDKAHLVPYGEYLPMPWLLRPLGLAQIVPGDIDATPGPGPRSFTLPPFGTIGVQICYEIIFSGEVIDAARRPSLLVNPSNDAWFGRWGPAQHLVQARLRAIEEGVAIVRSTPTGISALIAADGRVLASLPLGAAGAIEAAIPPALPPTLFARFGNWLALATAFVLLALAVASRRGAR